MRRLAEAALCFPIAFIMGAILMKLGLAPTTIASFKDAVIFKAWSLSGVSPRACIHGYRAIQSRHGSAAMFLTVPTGYRGGAPSRSLFHAVDQRLRVLELARR